MGRATIGRAAKEWTCFAQSAWPQAADRTHAIFGTAGAVPLLPEVLRPRPGHRIEPKGRSMPPVEIAQSDLSILALFLQAHWIVKTVMIGLLVCSIWVWAIAVDKFLLYARTAKAMDQFET